MSKTSRSTFEERNVPEIQQVLRPVEDDTAALRVFKTRSYILKTPLNEFGR